MIVGLIRWSWQCWFCDLHAGLTISLSFSVFFLWVFFFFFPSLLVIVRSEHQSVTLLIIPAPFVVSCQQAFWADGKVVYLLCFIICTFFDVLGEWSWTQNRYSLLVLCKLCFTSLSMTCGWWKNVCDWVQEALAEGLYRPWKTGNVESENLFKLVTFLLYVSKNSWISFTQYFW